MTEENIDREPTLTNETGSGPAEEGPKFGSAAERAETAEPMADSSKHQDVVSLADGNSGVDAESKESTATEQSAGASSKVETEGAGSPVDYSRTFRELSQGDVVDGIVVHIDKEGVLVDVGTKSEGIIRPNEVSAIPGQTAEEVLNVGDRIDVYVLKPENEDGNPVLSKKRADFEITWDRVQQAYEEGKTLTAMVTDRVKGGLVVDLGIRGFVPGSQVGTGNVKNLDRYVGQSLPFKVIEIDRDRRKVVLSHRLAVEEDRKKQRDETLQSLEEGQIREGIVRRITDYGAFVDLGGIDGLLHVSEMSWTRINHPSDVVRQGQRIKVMILKMDLNAGRISLGLRQILPDPWTQVAERYNVGDIVKGTISRLVPFGAFIVLDGGIEGIIPNTELSSKRVKKPEEVVSVGQQVEAKVMDIRPEERRITLSIRQTEEEADKKEYDSYQANTSSGRMTLGDLVGDKLQAFVSELGKEETPQAESVVSVEVETSEDASNAASVRDTDSKPSEVSNATVSPTEQLFGSQPASESQANTLSDASDSVEDASEEN